ncbi:MAG TPA: ABC transporter ATP-binding protein [Solirubrobacteraceae bacterium]|nr:ABC transporter ATP-binding protein [Solirubrobacteraceae bacterium]
MQIGKLLQRRGGAEYFAPAPDAGGEAAGQAGPAPGAAGTLSGATGEAAEAEPVLAHSALAIEFRHATKVYQASSRGEANVGVHDLSLTVPAGEICCLVGPSGGGKTTAMRLVNRLIDLTEGDILVGGRSITSTDPVRLRRDIGYVIQDVGLFPHLTIANNVAVPLRLHRWPKDRARARVDDLLTLVGLDAAMGKRYPAMLSGGQQQRVGLARALAVDPPIMLMDEPFGALDPITRARLQDEFLRLQRQLRKTVIFVTHDIDEALKMGDKVAVLREGGRLAQYASPEELLAAPADEFVASFIGADRGLKRLNLHRLDELCGEASSEVVDESLPTVSADASLRLALSILLETKAPAITVTNDDGPCGTVTLEQLVELLHAVTPSGAGGGAG